MEFPVRFAALALVGAAALATPAKADDKIGFIYVGPAADYGYNTSMDLGRQYVEKHIARRHHHGLRAHSRNRGGRTRDGTADRRRP